MRGLIPVLAMANLVACGPPPVRPQPTTPRPKANFFLRTGFDTDPSEYLGRFVPDGVEAGEVDDASSRKTSCSAFYKVSRKKGGDVRYEEYFAASTDASAGMSIPAELPVTLGASASAGRVVLVEYTLTDKWVADLQEPAGYARCCQQADGNCTERFVSEFLGGTGRIYYADSSAADASVGVPVAGFKLKDGLVWKQSVEFPNPVFFAFKLSPGKPGPSTADWTTKVPKVEHGKFFVGVSEWVESERLARDQSLLEVRRQVIRYLGEAIKQGSVRSERLSGRLGGLEAALEEKSTLARASEGVARFVKDEDWRVEKQQGPSSWRYRTKVLAFIDNSQLKAAAEAVAGALP